jgi:hypothetical protein
MMDEVLKQFTTKELLALEAGNLAEIPTEKLQLLQGAMPAPAPAAPDAPAESQMLRTYVQGLTAGFGEEAEARLRSAVTGRPVPEIEQEIRGQLQAFRQQSPVKALGAEAAGAATLGLAAAPFTGGTSLAATAPSVARVVGLSAAQGGLSGFGTAEGGFFDRIPGTVQGATVGAVAGPVGEIAMRGLGVPFNAVVDVARRQFGGRGAKAVEREVQRLVNESGLTPDEIVERIARGEIMAENTTLQQSVRALYTGGGEASSQIARTLGPRPDALRQQAMAQMQRSMTPGTGGNVLRQVRMDEDAIRTAERAMYGQAFGQGGVVTQPLLQNFSAAMQRAPKAAADITEYYRAQSGKTPFFNIAKDGNIEFSRTPTLEDMEIVRRGLQEQVNVAYQGGRGATGEALKDLERALRSEIDAASPAVGQARTTAAQTRSNREAFEDGRKIFGKSADEVDIIVSQMSPQQIQSLRAGAMDAIRNRMTTGSRKSLMGTMADESSKEGRILRSIFPQDQLPDLLQSVQVAAQSQQARNRIMQGSDTAASLQQARRIGMDTSIIEDATQIGQNPFALLRIAKRFVDRANPGLTDAQRLQVARILTSTDPDLVRRALTDDSAMAMLQQQLQTLGNQAATATRGAVSGIAGSRFSNPQQTGQ